ncbi:MAG TPA: ribosome biogenesis GTP-binding protein YihA/YsxC [Blastocatellia bacterium]|nr:ribosome biogenesis GTP-binding protein YihA/YsxC [Blastocatellia bacterium]
MKVNSARFVKSAIEARDYPQDNRPEVAFTGRSNVGKSSLINSLLGTRGLARTSSTPGRTQVVNFFLINDAFYFVDLPGYGYARVPTRVKKQWGPMIERYLATRTNLVLCVVIIDSRRGPTELDLQMVKWLESNRRPYLTVATKADKLSANELRTSMKRSADLIGKDAVIAYSAVKRTGQDRLWKEITSRIDGAGPSPRI